MYFNKYVDKNTFFFVPIIFFLNYAKMNLKIVEELKLSAGKYKPSSPERKLKINGC